MTGVGKMKYKEGHQSPGGCCFITANIATPSSYTSYSPTSTKPFIMRSILALFFGVAAAIPAGQVLAPPAAAPSDVKIISVSAIGSGCPAGHAWVNIDATRTIFDVSFDQYAVSVGPGASATDARKNCRVSINLQFPSGFQMSIIETRFIGYAFLAEGQTGTCRAGYTFSGDSSQEVVFQKNLASPYDDNYSMLAGVGVQSWSKCGASTAILNVNSEVRIAPITSAKKGIMTVSNPWRIVLRWQDC
ncbi:unnamed protein product [Sordaria macrospora k-hell]|uniref:WGS project CABT00000000 data, contig 2.44 n=1 Tax=Sordaria macrospora (strain ATCC MYA-333 / DSM 997 / K(L3346) / K-hell) TaxID=771870 RepID=F7W8B8_SORMK|nr:uncharacterized protein SMAC_07272 [Sordaria macrospora k-hell]KAH7625318.1 hypothetical protein B0T09DRAFT_315311 [Sordaria sp. MPI-SDFR-AT-0083]CCC13763.1 unnamed protein product [Sordaria macrospora k-hell]